MRVLSDSNYIIGKWERSIHNVFIACESSISKPNFLSIYQTWTKATNQCTPTTNVRKTPMALTFTSLEEKKHFRILTKKKLEMKRRSKDSSTINLHTDAKQFDTTDYSTAQENTHTRPIPGNINWRLQTFHKFSFTTTQKLFQKTLTQNHHIQINHPDPQGLPHKYGYKQ